MGKGNRPVEVMAWVDTLVHPIEAEDNAIALIKFESGAMGQFEVSWTFRGGMDLRDEVAGTDGTIWTNHFLRTGFEMFSSGEGGGYVAEKAETASGWLFPVGDEVAELGYVDMFTDMFDSLDEGRQPRESFYDGYVVNTVMDAVYASASSRQWEPVRLDDWRGGTAERIARTRREHDGKTVIKEEQMPDGRRKLILKDESTGRFSDVVA
jgi:predicted dehydrogenase